MPFLTNKFTFKRCPTRKMDSTSLIYRSHMSATEARKEFGLECGKVSLSLPSASHEEKWNKFVFEPTSSSWFEERQKKHLQQEQEQQSHHLQQHQHQHQQEQLIEFSETIDSQLNKKLADENRLLRLKIEILMDLVRM